MKPMGAKLRAGDEAITRDGERVTLLRPAPRDTYVGPAVDGRLWIVRLASPDPSNPSDKVEFPVRECNMERACNGRLNMCQCHQPCPPSKFIRARWPKLEGCCSFCKPDPMRELEREIVELETAASFTDWMKYAERIRGAFDRLRATSDPSPRR